LGGLHARRSPALHGGSLPKRLDETTMDLVQLCLDRELLEHRRGPTGQVIACLSSAIRCVFDKGLFDPFGVRRGEAGGLDSTKDVNTQQATVIPGRRLDETSAIDYPAPNTNTAALRESPHRSGHEDWRFRFFPLSVTDFFVLRPCTCPARNPSCFFFGGMPFPITLN